LNAFEIVRLAFGALTERKLRTILTILMVMIGVSLVTSLDGLGGGFDRYIEDQLNTLGANVLIISPSGGGGGFGPPVETPETKLTSQTVRTIDRVLGIDHAVPFYSGGVTLKAGSEEKGISIIGIDQSKLKYVTPKINLESGSFVSETDTTGIILGYNIANPPDLDKPLAKRGQVVSIIIFEVEEIGGGRQTLKEKKKSFQVKGIIEELGNMQVDNTAYISTSAANSLLDKNSIYDGIYGITRDADENEEIEERIRKIYGDNIGIISPKSLIETIQEIVGTFTAFLSTVAMVSLFVAAVGIITTLYTSVMERTREIGLLKALGYGKSTILFMFLTESMTIGTLGGIMGILTGATGAYLLGKFVLSSFGGPGSSAINPVFTSIQLIEVFMLALILSIIAGLYPAWRAAKLSPISALRKE
jgi:putative ABC transport system permease protein